MASDLNGKYKPPKSDPELDVPRNLVS